VTRTVASVDVEEGERFPGEVGQDERHGKEEAGKPAYEDDAEQRKAR